MGIRNAGVRLTMEGLSAYLSGGKQIDEANKKTKSSLDAVAEAERRATIAARAAARERSAAASAESKERVAAAEKIIQAERRQTIELRAQIAQQTAARREATRAAQQEARAARTTSGGGGFAERLGGSVASGIGRAGLGLGLGFLGLQGAQQAIGGAAELDILRGQALRTDTALNSLAGGSTNAALAIRQIQAAAPGATSRLEAAQSATTILTQKLNSSAVSLTDIAKAVAIIPQVSPSIRDQADAISQLTLFGNSASFARADQLAVRASDVKARVKELAATYPELDDAQLKVASTVQLLLEKFSTLGDKAPELVTGIQKLKTAWADFREEVARGQVGKTADEVFGDVGGFLNRNAALLGSQDRQVQIGALEHLQNNAQSQADMMKNLPKVGGGGLNALLAVGAENNVRNIEKTIQALEQLDKTSGPEGLKNQIVQLADEIIRSGAPTQEHLQRLQVLQTALTGTAGDLGAFAASNRDFASQQAEAAALAKEKALEIAEVRAQVDELTKSSLDLFAQGAPGADDLSQSLIELQGNLAGHTTLTEEDAAAVAAAKQEFGLMAAAAGQSVDGVDAATLAAYRNAQANQVLATSLQAVAAAQAGVSRGIVSSISGLVGGGIINQGQALAIERSQQQQAAAGFAGMQGLQGPALAFATAGLQRELEAPFREWDQISKNITQEAHAQHQASQGASKEWNKAQKDAEKAAKATQKALESVPGLFGLSKVTEGDMAKAKGGLSVNFADDFVRRFRDVAENFEKRSFDKQFRPDFGPDQIKMAQEALRNIGIDPVGIGDKPAEQIKALFAQFEEAWSNLSLFSDKENLALINQDAVQQQLDLQKKMEEGRKNIFELYGVAIDDATEAVGAGGSIPFDQEGLNKKLAEAEAKFWEGVAARAESAMSFGSSGVSLSDQVRSGGSSGIQTVFNGFVQTSEILRGTFDDVTSTSDILRERLVLAYEASGAFATRLDEIPQLVWYGDGGVIDTFPAWKGDEGIIPVFPGWDAWLGPEKPNTGPTDMGATGTAGATTVTPVQQAMTQPAVNTTNNTRSTNVTINSNQSTGNLLGDWAIIEAKSR